MLISVLYILILVSDILSQYIPTVGYLDEAVTFISLLGCVPLLLYGHEKERIMRRRALLFLLLLLIIGGLGTVLYEIQTSTEGVLKDVLAVSKFFVIYVGMTELIDRVNTRYWRWIVIVTKTYIAILFMFCIVSFFVDLGMTSDTRFAGIPVYQFLYSHPTFLATIECVLVTVLLTDGFGRNKLFVIMGCLTLLMTFRTKAAVFLLAVILIPLVRAMLKGGYSNRRKSLLTAGILVTALAVVFGYDKINEYLAWGTTAARPALYIRGLQVMVDFFPLGSGFCTFGSSLSGEYYSPLYYEYGMSSINGITPYEYNYIGDTFWPYIYAQFGILGLLFYLFALNNVYRSIKAKIGDKWFSNYALFCFGLYFLGSCFVEAVPTNSSCLAIAFCFVLIGYFGKVEESCYERKPRIDKTSIKKNSGNRISQADF